MLYKDVYIKSLISPLMYSHRKLVQKAGSLFHTSLIDFVILIPENNFLVSIGPTQLRFPQSGEFKQFLLEWQARQRQYKPNGQRNIQKLSSDSSDI